MCVSAIEHQSDRTRLQYYGSVLLGYGTFTNVSFFDLIANLTDTQTDIGTGIKERYTRVRNVAI